MDMTQLLVSEFVAGSRIGFLERGLRDVYPCILAMQMGCFGATTISGKLTGHDGHVPATVQGVSIVHRESRDATYTSSRGRTCQHTWKTNRYCVCDFLQPLPQKSANVA